MTMGGILVVCGWGGGRAPLSSGPDSLSERAAN